MNLTFVHEDRFRRRTYDFFCMWKTLVWFETSIKALKGLALRFTDFYKGKERNANFEKWPESELERLEDGIGLSSDAFTRAIDRLRFMIDNEPEDESEDEA